MDEGEIGRVLRLLKEGRLTEAQAEAMIEAIQGSGGRFGADQKSDQDVHLADKEGHTDGHDEMRSCRRRHAGSRHRAYRNGDARVEIDFGLGDTVVSAINHGLQSAATAFRGSGFGPTYWLNESNVSTLSKLQTPRGDDYTCRDNNINVSQIRDLVLRSSWFADNELNAAGIHELDIVSGEFRGNEMHGSSIRQMSIDHGGLVNCQFNGSQIVSARVTHGKLDDCSFNGCYLRNLEVESATLLESKFNGVKISDFGLSGDARVTGLSFNGAKCRDFKIEQGSIDDLQFSGLRVEQCRFTNCDIVETVFKNDNWVGGTHHANDGITSLVFDTVTAKDLMFINCRFDNTTFRNCRLEGMTFKDVDFSDMTIDSAQSARALAEQAAGS